MGIINTLRGTCIPCVFSDSYAPSIQGSQLCNYDRFLASITISRTQVRDEQLYILLADGSLEQLIGHTARTCCYNFGRWNGPFRSTSAIVSPIGKCSTFTLSLSKSWFYLAGNGQEDRLLRRGCWRGWLPRTRIKIVFSICISS